MTPDPSTSPRAEEDRTADLRGRLAALEDAAALMARHGIAHDVDVDGLAAHARGRLRHGTDRTVVALAGGTGAGKSSLLNAIAGQEVARAGVTRPTTSVTQAVVFGRPADGLLDHLGITRRHGLPDPDGVLDGLVLLDLPDFDSVARSHRLEVDRLVALVDLLVWVTDPQKYADQALHDGYLRPLADHAEVVEVVLNKADLLPPAEVGACLADLRRLLTADGLGAVEPVAVSATTGAGLEALTGMLAAEVAARQAVVDRLSADLRRAAGALRDAAGAALPTGPDQLAADLVDGMADAAGVPALAGLVAAQHRRDAALATGWPPVRWVRRLRRAPLTRLRVTAEDTVARAEVSRALRRAGDALGGGTTGGGTAGGVTAGGGTAGGVTAGGVTAGGAGSGVADGIRRAAVARVRESVEPMVAALDTQASRRTQALRRPPGWWSAVGSLQSLLVVVAAVGGLWLLGLALADSLLRLDVEPFAPDVRGVPLPTALLLGGLLAGFVVAGLAGLAARLGARRRARRAAADLREGVAEAVDAVVLDPLRLLESDRDAWDELLAAAAGRWSARA